jgi:hypothetical protein
VRCLCSSRAMHFSYHHLHSSNVDVHLIILLSCIYIVNATATAKYLNIHSMNTSSLMVGRSDECVRQLRDLLHISETANDEQIINIIKESNNIQVMLKLRKSRWTKVCLI